MNIFSSNVNNVNSVNISIYFQDEFLSLSASSRGGKIHDWTPDLNSGRRAKLARVAPRRRSSELHNAAREGSRWY